MAFNPLTNFQKYKKIWTASLIFIAMVTFVLCSGMGDENSGLQGWFRRVTQKRGEPVARIAGENYYPEDVREIKDNRELANKYMRKVLERSADVLQYYLKNPEEMRRLFRDREVTAWEQGTLLKVYRDYVEKLKQPRFFEGADNLTGLVDFKVLLLEADRLNIHLTDDHVRKLVNSEAFLFVPAEDPKNEPVQTPLLSRDDYGEISRFVQGSVPGATDDRIAQAVRDEMRVRLARLAMLEAPNLFSPEPVPPRTGKKEDLALFEFQYSHWFSQDRAMREAMRGKEDGEQLTKTRTLLTPDQWYEYYKKNRVTFEVSLVPIRTEDLMDKVQEPEQEVLRKFFEAHKTVPEDITADKTGLQKARDRFTVHILMANPNAPRFKTKARATLAIQAVPPVIWDPMMPPLLTHWSYPLSEALKGEVVARRMAERSGPKVREILNAGRVGDRDYASHLLVWLSRREPAAQAALANMVAAGFGDGPQLISALPLFVDQARKVDEELFQRELSAQMEKEREFWLPVYATFMATTESPLLSLAPATLAYEPWAEMFEHTFIFDRAGLGDPLVPALMVEERQIPRSLYVDEEWDKLVQEKATEYVRDVMIEARKRLKGPEVVGTRSRLDVHLRGVLEDLGVTMVSSKRPYNMVEMERAPELEPLRKAFEKHAPLIDLFEGRKKNRLQDESFAEALFFSSGEKHSLEGRAYTPRAWPPDLQTQQKPEMIEYALAVVEGRPADPKKAGLAIGERIEERLQSPDPRVTMNEVSLFNRADNPIIFWKEETPKADPTPRWETEIRKDVERQVKSLTAETEKRIARLKAERKASEKELQRQIETLESGLKKEIASLNKKAEEQIQETRERTLRAYKLTQARDKLAPKLVDEIARKLAETGGEAVTALGPYQEALSKLDKKPIVLRGIAPWYLVQTRAGHFEYRDFFISDQDGIPFPRPEMAKQLLRLPTLEEPIQTGYAPIDALNKELFKISAKAFQELKADKKLEVDTKPRIVQVIPNRPRTEYYIALLTSPKNPPEVLFNPFQRSITVTADRSVDPFLGRVYEEASKKWREEVLHGVNGLWRRHDAEVFRDTEAAKAFETDGGE